MRPLEFYGLGLAAAHVATSEPQQRTVVNRLYYGLHHEACCRYFRQHPGSPAIRRHRRHTDLQARFNGSTNPISKTVGNLLNDLRRLRTEADYNLVPPFSFGSRLFNAQQLLDLALESARRLLDVLETYSPGEAEDGCHCAQVQQLVWRVPSLPQPYPI